MGSDNELNTQLLTNRAAAQFHIGNYRSSVNDCQAAIKINPSHMKAIIRGAQCHNKMKHYAECRDWCGKGLELESSHEELLKLRQDSVQKVKALEGDERKRMIEEKRKKIEENVVLDLITQRGIKVASSKGSSSLSLADLE